MPDRLNSLIDLFNRDLNKLKHELESYSNEANLWLLKDSIKNTAGNLAWHLVGNLKHFIGATLGQTGYVRDRPGEFNDKDIPRATLVKGIEDAKAIINSTLPNLSVDQLDSTYPIEVFGKPMSTQFFLMHLHSHLNYHLGQINYHRRMLDR